MRHRTNDRANEVPREDARYHFDSASQTRPKYKEPEGKERYEVRQYSNGKAVRTENPVSRTQRVAEVNVNDSAALENDLVYIGERVQQNRKVTKEVERFERENLEARKDMEDIKQKSKIHRKEFEGFKEQLYTKNEKISMLNDGIRELDTRLESCAKENKDMDRKQRTDSRLNEALSSKYRSQLDGLGNELSWLQESEVKGKQLIGKLETDLSTARDTLQRLRDDNRQLENVQAKLVAERDLKRREVQEIELNVKSHKDRSGEWSSQLTGNLELFERLNADYEKVLNKLREMESECSRLTLENDDLKRVKGY